MEKVLDADTFFSNREKAKFYKRDEMAEDFRGALSAKDRTKLRFFPVQIGEVDWGEWDEGDQRKGTPRRLPLYLFQHDDHVSADYPNGYPGHNERLTCHCGYRHYFASSRYREVRMFGALLMFAIRMRIAQIFA